ncbi:hypothetical protein ABIC20_003036 [Methylobacterium radiotolerans]|uniref:Uncharacterized protein n=1 Tax=Methylobacterium radiotolerans TaxID=31998 RepID=A0ABV2NGU9_9HYPH
MPACSSGRRARRNTRSTCPGARAGARSGAAAARSAAASPRSPTRPWRCAASWSATPRPAWCSTRMAASSPPTGA